MNTPPRILTLGDMRAEANPWPAPVPFGRREPPTLNLDEAIPSTLPHFRDFILATAGDVQFSPDAVAPLAMALVSFAASRAFEVKLLAQWTETAPLWVIVLAVSGERKSALITALTKPLGPWEKAERARLNDALAAYSNLRRTTEARLSGIRLKISKAKPSDVSALEREAEDLAIHLSRMPDLLAPDLITTDATPEAMRGLLTRNGEKLVVIAAEIDAAQLMGSRYSTNGGANFDLFLKAFTGEPCPAHRVQRDLPPLVRPSLAMVLAGQPAAMDEVLRDPLARDRGLVPRMVFVQPASLMGKRELTPPALPQSLAKWWSDTLRGILDCPWPGRVILNGDSPCRCEQPARVLTLDPDAHVAFCALRKDIESKLSDGGELRPISGFASKLPGVVARLALGFQLMESITSAVVRAPAMVAACAWAPFLIGHFRAVLKDADERPERRHARRLVDALRRRGERETTKRECFLLIDNQSDMASMTAFEPVLAELIADNYLRPQPETARGKGRPASPRFEVNPAVFTEA